MTQFVNWSYYVMSSELIFCLFVFSEPPPTTPSTDDEDEQPVNSGNKPREGESSSGNVNSRPPQSSGPLPQQFRPSQSGVRLVG